MSNESTEGQLNDFYSRAEDIEAYIKEIVCLINLLEVRLMAHKKDLEETRTAIDELTKESAQNENYLKP